MEIKNLMAEGDFKVSSLDPGDNHGTIHLRGKLPGFGDVWVEYTMFAGTEDVGRTGGMVSGHGRALAEDGTLVAAKIAGIWSRQDGTVTLTTLDHINNGDQVIVRVTVDLRADTAHLAVYELS
jgi:hypothetical protein